MGALLLAGTALSAVAANTATVTSSANTYSAAGGQVTFTVTLGYTTSLAGLDLHLVTPAGWKYVSTGGTNVPNAAVPSADDLGAFGYDFVYSTIPASPVSFTFTVSYPAGLTGNQSLTAIQAHFSDEATGNVSNVDVPNVTLTAAPTAPAFSTNPTSQTIVSGANVVFTVAATGNPTPTLKWQKSIDAGANWTDLVEGGRISGTTTATLTITGALTTDAASYRAFATNTQGTFPSTTATLTVNKASQVITFGALSSPPFGVSPFTLSATASSGLTVTYTSSNLAVATVSGNTLTVVGVGTSVITANQAGNSEFNAAAAVPQTLNVAFGSQTITFGALAAKTFGDAPYALTATASSALAVSYASSNTNVATISGSTITLVGAGNTTITASQTGSSNYSAATPVTQVLTVNKKNQTISFSAVPSRAFTAAPFALAATVDSPLTVAYTSSNPGVATVSGNTVTIVGVGNTTLTASQSGDSNYNAATPVQQTLTITAANQAITFAAIPARTFAPGDTFTLGATASSALAVSYASSNAAVATVSGSTVTITGAGNTTITASQAGNSNFAAAADVTQVLTVNKATAQVTLANLSPTYDGTPKSATATTTPAGLTVTFTYDGGPTPPTNAGTYAVVATVVSDNYTGTASSSLVIGKATQDITFAALPAKTYGDAPFSLSATSTSPQPITFSSTNQGVATVSGNTVTIVGAGSTTITAGQTSSANYLVAGNVSQTLTVNKAAATLTLASLSATYDGTPKAATATTAPSGLAVNFTYDGNATAPTNAGNYTVVGTINSSNYTGSGSGTLTIAKAAQTITFAALASHALDEAPLTLTGTSTSGLPLTYTSSDPTVASIGGPNGNVVTFLHTGNITITASQAGSGNYLPATSVTQSLVVLNASQTITFAGTELGNKTYAPGATIPLVATSNRGLTVSFTSSDTNVATIAGSTLTIVGAGNATITAKQAGNADFAAAPDVARTLSVAKAVATVTLGSLTPTYDGTPKAATATTVPAGLNVTYTYAGNATAPTNVGTYAVVGTVVDNNYTGTASGSLVIAKAAQTITFGALTAKTFGDANFDLGATATSSLTIGYTSSNTSVATVSGKTVTIVGAGNTTITASQAGDSNYNAASSVTQTLTVGKAGATVTLGSLTVIYDGTPKAATAVTSPVGIPVTFTYNGNATAPTVVGNYTVVGTINSANYAGSATGTLFIGKAAQTISFAAPGPHALDEAPITLTGTSSSGLPLTYVTSDPNVATISGPNGNILTFLHTGNITITASQPGDSNYNAATPVTQSLLVSNASQTITFAGTELANKTYAPGATIPLVATSNRGLPVSFTSSNPAVATIAGSTLTITGAGNATITAQQAGNSDYGPAPDVARVLTVAKAAATGTLAGLAQTYDGTPKSVTATTTPTGLTVTFTYAGNATAPTNAGSYPVVGTIVDANYSGTINGSLVIAKASQTITFGALTPKLANAAPFALTATASSSLAVTYTSSVPSVATISGSTVNILNYGTTVITAKQAGDANYNAAVDVTQSLLVNPIAPVILSTPPLAQTAVKDRSFQFGPITINNTQATFSATGLPDGLSVNSVLGTISGTPTAVTVSPVSIVLKASNVTGEDTRTITLTVLAPSPVITSAASASGRVNTPFTFAVVATNTPSSYAATGLPPGLVIDGTTGAITGTPTVAGTYSAQLTATNTTGAVTQAFVIVIDPPLNAPVYAGPVNLSGTQGAVFSFTPSFGTVTAPYALTGSLPTGLNFTAATGAIAGTPTQTGSFSVALAATNAGGTTSANLTIVINPAATAPVITSASFAAARVGTAFSFQLVAAGTPAATSYAASGLPAGLSINTTTGLITGTPTAFGSFDVVVSASTTGVGTGPSAVLSITVSPSASAPVITSSPVISGQVGVAFSGVTLAASPTATSFAVTSGTLPAGLQLATNGAITGTPLTAAIGQTRVWVAGTAGTGPTAVTGFAVELLFTIAPAAATPVVNSNGSATAQVGQPFQYVITATNGPLTSYAASGRPAWLALDPSTGILSGVPTEPTTTAISLSISATNAAGVGKAKTLLLTVVPAPATPAITSPLTASGRAGGTFTYQMAASNSPTSFVATGLPAGLSFNPTTGAVTGTPTTANTYSVSLSAANGGGLGAPSTLVIDVAPALSAPAIQSAATAPAQVGVSFTYQITVRTTDTPILSYALVGTGTLPLGLTLNTSTGAITGTPSDDPRAYAVQLTATNAGGTSLPQTLTINLTPASGTPVLTTPLYVSGTVGGNFSLTITANNFGEAPYAPPFVLEAISLPSGLALNSSAGTIVGQPTTVGTTVATLVATNASGTGPTRDLTFTISPAASAPVVSAETSVIGQVNQPFTYQILASNGPLTSYEVLDAPVWMTLNPLTGLISGLPTAPGLFTVRLTATNASGTSAPVVLPLTIQPAANTPIITSTRTAGGTVGLAFTYTPEAAPAATGYTVTGLPGGLSLNTTTGVISGTPTKSGVFRVLLTPANANGTGAPVEIIVTILPNVTFGS